MRPLFRARESFGLHHRLKNSSRVLQDPLRAFQNRIVTRAEQKRKVLVWILSFWKVLSVSRACSFLRRDPIIFETDESHFLRDQQIPLLLTLNHSQLMQIAFH